MIKLFFAVKILLARRIYCRSPFVLSFCLFFSNFPLQKRYILRKRAGVRWKIFVGVHVFANFARKIIQTPFRRCHLQTPDILPFYRLQSFLLFKMHFVCLQRRFFLCGVSKLNATCKLPPTRGFPCFLLPFHDKILLTFLPKRFPETPGKCPCLFC